MISMRTRSRDNCSRPARAGDAGGDPCRVERALAIGGMEAEEAQDAQVVFRDARGGVADEAHAPRLDVGEPADIVVDRAVARGATARSW